MALRRFAPSPMATTHSDIAAIFLSTRAFLADCYLWVIWLLSPLTFFVLIQRQAFAIFIRHRITCSIYTRIWPLHLTVTRFTPCTSETWGRRPSVPLKMGPALSLSIGSNELHHPHGPSPFPYTSHNAATMC